MSRRGGIEGVADHLLEVLRELVLARHGDWMDLEGAEDLWERKGPLILGTLEQLAAAGTSQRFGELLAMGIAWFDERVSRRQQRAWLDSLLVDDPGAALDDHVHGVLRLARSRLALVDGDLALAEADLTIAQARFSAETPTIAGIATAGSLAALHARRQEFASALEHNTRQLEWARALEDAFLIREAELNLAASLEGAGRLDEALDVYARVAQAAEEQGFVETQARALQNLGGLLRLRGQLPQARAAHEQQLRLARAHRMRRLEGVATHSIALVYDSVGEPEQALALFERALALRREVGDLEGEIATLGGLAQCLKNLGRLDEARQTAERWLDRARGPHVIFVDEGGARSAADMALHGLFNIALAQGDLEAAGRALAERATHPQRNPRSQVTLHHSAFQLYRRLGHAEEAEEALRACLEPLAQTQFLSAEVIVHRQLGGIELGHGRLELAASHLRQAWNGARKLGTRWVIAETAVQMAEVHIHCGLFDEATAVLRTALDALEADNSPRAQRFRSDTDRALAEIERRRQASSSQA